MMSTGSSVLMRAAVYSQARLAALRDIYAGSFFRLVKCAAMK